MSHITHHKKRLTSRLNRLIGQLQGIQRMVEEAAEGDDLACYKVMQQLSAVRGNVNGLMAQLMEEHVHHHVVEQEDHAKRQEGASELLKVIRSFSR